MRAQKRGIGMKIIIRDNQAGFVLKNGIFVKMITAGTYHYSRLMGYEVVVEEMSGEMDITWIPYAVLEKDDAFRRSTVRIEVPDGYLGFLYINSKLRSVLTKKEIIYWNAFDTYEVKLVSMETEEIGKEVTKRMLELIPTGYYKTVSVGDGEVALLYYNNILQKQLAKGVYAFWNYRTNVTIKVFDMRQKVLDIVGQEILTKDKIGIRMNISCMYKIRDVQEFAEKISDLKGQLYTYVQLVIREMTGNYKLDEILEMKDTVSREVFAKLREQEERFCVEFLSAGIKDIILPGGIQEIMNSVLVAEKTAQANVIARREEVASTRSLLNTAKLMDENKTLYRLKELEYLERICDRVGEISVNGNGGLVEQLGKLVGNA